MKINKAIWIVLGYLIIVVSFYYLLGPISELLQSIFFGQDKNAFEYLDFVLNYIGVIIISFVIIINLLSYFFLFRSLSRNQKEKVIGFGITSVLSTMIIAYIIIGIIMDL